MRPRVLLALLVLLALPLAGQTFSRQVLPARSGPQRLDVDLALLGATRAALADVRLQDGEGREVPYVLVPPDPEEAPWVPARLLPLAATRATSGLELDLGTRVRVSRLRLDGLRAPFLKRFRLEGSGDRQRWTELVQAGTLFDLPGEGLKLLEVAFPEGEYRYVRVVWDDHASAPLALPRAALLRKADFAPGLPRVDLAFRKRPAEPGVSRFALSLPGPRIPLRALLLTVKGEGPLLREAQVTEARLTATSLAPRCLGTARLQRTQRQGALAWDLRIPVTAPEGSELELRVLDGDNPGLELTAIEAELEPQPWIYFEAPGLAPLTVTCGEARAEAPHYDLEALREQLVHKTLARASWGPASQAAAPSAPAPELDLGAGAVLARAGFRFQRSVPAGAPGLTALALDAHVLAHSPHLQDLRLLDPSGRQIPYLLEARDEPLNQDLAWPKGVTRGPATTYRLQLPQPALPPSRLVLETGTRVFRRRVKILQGDPPVAVAIATWSHGEPGSAAPALVVPLPALTGTEVTVQVEEGDNRPLAIQSARLLLPSWRLRFFRSGEPFLLCYGQDLPAPDYDLALLADRLREAPARELSLPAATAPTFQDPAKRMMGVFWGALVLAVVALLGLLVRVLRR